MKTVETFLSVPGYEGLYEISNLGNIKSLRSGKLMKKTKNNDGYEAVSLTKNGKSRGYFVHRLVALTFIPNPDNLPEVNHKDECRDNNVVDNLEWCTKKYNRNYGTYRERMSALKTGKPNPRKNKIQVEEYDPLKKIREQLRKEREEREEDQLLKPFWKRKPKKVNEFVEWSKVMDALGEKDDEVLLEDKAVMTLNF